MKKKALSLSAAVAAVCFFISVFLPTSANLPEADALTVTLSYTNEAVDGEIEISEPNIEKAEKSATEPSSEQLLLNMLNLNYCYTNAFKSTECIAIASAVSLRDYATDIPGYGLSVSKVLCAGFIKSFYGKELDLSTVKTEYAPEGFIALPCYEVGSQDHEIVSVTHLENGEIEVISTVTFTYGGYDADSYTAVSHFIESSASEYGFFLLECSLL